MQQHVVEENCTRNNVIVCRIFRLRRSVLTGQVACMWEIKNIPNVSYEKSEQEGVIVRCGFRWFDTNWIFKTEGVMVFSRL
jgi:hypothetical protein